MRHCAGRFLHFLPRGNIEGHPRGPDRLRDMFPSLLLSASVMGTDSCPKLLSSQYTASIEPGSSMLLTVSMTSSETYWRQKASVERISGDNLLSPLRYRRCPIQRHIKKAHKNESKKYFSRRDFPCFFKKSAFPFLLSSHDNYMIRT